MPSKVFSAALVGVHAHEVEVEVHSYRGMDGRITMVGLPDVAVRESKDRVVSAISNSALRWPQGRITVNLAPADLRKEGPSFDLPIAMGMLRTLNENNLPDLDQYCLVGELALSGQLRPIKGALAVALEARRRGRQYLIVPSENAGEAAVVQGIAIFGVSSLKDVVDFLRGDLRLVPVDAITSFAANARTEQDFSEVKGQRHVKRAVEVAAAGGHNLLMLGPPGSGKSMIAKRIPSILPPITLEEAIESTKIHSICGLLNAEHDLVRERPFRSPHHTVSDAGLLGGGTNHPSPGEVSLAHHGVLFLDELPEFHRSTLEVLRQPLEDGRVTISRASGSVTFPASFMLVAAMNPCPCGHFGDPHGVCRCTPGQVQKYRSRLSGPLLDRIDLHADVPAIALQDLTSNVSEESSATIRERVALARMIQLKRFVREPGIHCNARLTPRLIRQHCQMESDGLELLKHAVVNLNLSARAYDRILKVARTIADLGSCRRIGIEHLAEAVQYRSLDRYLW